MAPEGPPEQSIQEDLVRKESPEVPNKNAAMQHVSPGQDILEVPEELATAVNGRPAVPGPPYKRGRGRSFFKGGTRKGIACQVPGCDRSLLKLREYYKRYKICEYHLELECMVVEGQTIRFCQQCGRFQLLDEFDGDRRSCRRKLKKHNERRRVSEVAETDSDTETKRKRRPSKSSDARYSSETAGFQPESSNPMADMLRAMTGDAAFTQQLSRPMVAAMRNAESDDPNHFQQPAANSYRESPHIDPTLLAMLADCAVPTAVPTAADSGFLQAPKSLEDLVREATGGSYPAIDGAGGSNGAPMAEAAGTSNGQPNTLTNIDTLLHQIACALGVNLKPPSVHPQQAPVSVPLPSLPALSTLGLTPEAASQLGHILIQLGQQPEGAAAAASGSSLPGAPPPPPPPPPSCPSPAPPQQPPIASQQEIATVSLKLFNSLPSQLPPALLHELMDWMTNKRTHMEVAMRPGCVHLTTAALLTQKEKDAMSLDVRASALRIAAETSLGRNTPFILQIHSTGGVVQAALVQDGAVRMVLDKSLGSSEGKPTFVRPLACVPSPTADVVIFGGGLDMLTDKITCRNHGMQPVLEVQRCGPAVTGVPQGVSGGWARLRIPAPRLGAHILDVQRDVFVGASATFLVLDDEELVAEIRQLEFNTTGVADVDSFLHKVGLIVTQCDKGCADKEVAERVALVAQEVAAVALRRRWPVLLRMALPAVGLAGCMKAGVAGIVRCLGNNVSLLQAAVVSGCPEMIKVIGWWAALNGVDLVGFPGSNCASCFHLVAMLQNPVPLAEALVDAIPTAYMHFTTTPWGGRSPLALAQALNQDALVQFVEKLGAASPLSMYDSGKGTYITRSRDIGELRFKEFAAMLNGDILSAGESERPVHGTEGQPAFRATSSQWWNSNIGVSYSSVLVYAMFVLAVAFMATFVQTQGADRHY